MYIIAYIEKTGLYKAFNMSMVKKVEIKKRATGDYAIMMDDETAMVYKNYDFARNVLNAIFEKINEGTLTYYFPTEE